LQNLISEVISDSDFYYFIITDLKSNSFISNANKLTSLLDSLFSVDLDIQLDFLKRLPEPKDNFERSYFQYKCQQFLQKKYWTFMYASLSFLAYIPFVFYLIIKKKNKGSSSPENNAVFIFAGASDLIPKNLFQSFDKIDSMTFGNKYYLNAYDLKFAFRLFLRYPFSTYFNIKTIYKIAFYRAIINDYHPKAIICSSEYSFTSSVLTSYCEEQNITHINVMHGEKFLFIRDSFFKFHQFYIWDEYYISVFKTLRADMTQFRVEVPPCLIMSKTDKPDMVFDYTYYLGGETESEIRKINDTLNLLHSRSFKICIRLHPRYSDKELAAKVFSTFQLELPDSVTIAQSFERTKCLISLYSTVLFQGYLNGKIIVIDDVSDQNKYEKLKVLKYIMISKPHIQLSKLIK